VTDVGCWDVTEDWARYVQVQCSVSLAIQARILYRADHMYTLPVPSLAPDMFAHNLCRCVHELAHP
jgi:hypothetical protein